MFAALALLSAPTDSLMAPGVSQELARYRAAHVRDVRYDLTLDLRNRDTARGTVRISFTRLNGGDAYLDFRGHYFDSVIVNDVPMPAVEYNRSHMRFESQSLREGRNAIYVRFASPIAPAGASVIRFTDDTDTRDYLYTLLVPSDANLLFPCFDQPDLKAVFAFTAKVPPDWTVLSNSRERLEAIGAAPSRIRTFVFNDTKPISTYLFAFAAGPWAQRYATPPATPAMQNAVEAMRLWARQSRAREAETDTLVALNRRAMHWLISYFDVPYPFEKLDFLLAPAFPFGGMEHPGAIFYNEESFIFREPPTLVQRLGRQATVNHEVAHQWFGDFTTMRWFDDLWMKEGFATYMAAKMQAAMGDSTAWMSFYLRNKPSAYDVDASAGTTPVWQQLANLDQAKSNYGAIVYNKAPGVLKQLNHLVGETAFRSGVRAFLRSHAYGNGTWQELLDAVGTAAGRDLRAWGRAYFVRPGMPIVEQQLAIGSNGRIARLALVQHPAQPLSGRGAWPMKVDVRIQYDGTSPVMLPVEMRAETTLVAGAVGLPAPNFVYANANDYGYGLFMLDDRSRDWLLAHGVAVRDPLLRAMLWGSLWDLVRDARLDPRRYVRAALDALPAERDEQIASRLVARVGRALETYFSDRLLQAQAESLFLRQAVDNTLSYGLRKSYFDAYVGVSRTPAALTHIDAWLDSAFAAGLPLRQPTRWSIVTHLVSLGAPHYSERLSAEIERDTTTGGRRRGFIARAAIPRPELKRAYFDSYFRDSTLNEDWVTASLGAFNAQDQDALTLSYLRPALDSLPWIQRNRRIFFLGSWLTAFIGGQRTAPALAVVDAYLAEHPDLARDLRQKVLQARDDLERTVRIRATFEK